MSFGWKKNMTTMLEVAKRAGVSKATVSRVLSGNGYVSQETKDRVFQAIEESGYRPNLLARNLATKRTQTLGLVVTNTLYHGVYFSELLFHAARMTEEKGRQLILADGKHSADEEREAIQYLLDMRCDAVIIYPRFLSVEEMDEIVEKYEQPIMAPGPEHSVMADKLQALVGLFIKRRLKKDVLTDLPDKFENVLTVKLEGEQRKLYAAHEQRLRATLTKASDADFNTKKIRILAEFTLLREICCDPRLVYADAKNASAKLDAIVELVATCMDEGKKVLVFSQFTSFLELIGARLAEQGVEYYTITGETPKKRRVELVDEFNGNDVPVFLISLKAGNTGLNLVGASVVVHADPWWNAAAQNQATDRAHRIGQTQDVNVYQIVAKDTIEERILKLQEKKNELARQFTDGTASGGVGTLSKDDLLGLLS